MFGAAAKHKCFRPPLRVLRNFLNERRHSKSKWQDRKAVLQFEASIPGASLILRNMRSKWPEQVSGVCVLEWYYVDPELAEKAEDKAAKKAAKRLRKNRGKETRRYGKEEKEVKIR